MIEEKTIQGRSLVFNMIFVFINLLGVAFMTMGFHDNFEEQSSLFKFLGIILLIGSIGGLIIFKGRFIMSSVSRVLVGGLFIVSGLVKANDPIGFAYKLEEYFEDGALAFRIKEWFSAPEFSLEFFMEHALLLSVVICIAEIILGVLVILGGKIKLVSTSMMLMMVFFTFLTWHTSNCDSSIRFLDRDTYQIDDPIGQIKIKEAEGNKDLTIVEETMTFVVIDEMKQPQCVDDCGCFGDAMKGSVGRSLTPKESFWKDIILVYLIGWIFFSMRIIAPNSHKENKVYIGAAILVLVFFSWVFGWYFPVLFGVISLLGSLWVVRVGGKYFGNYYGSALFITVLCSIMVAYVLMYLPMKDYRSYSEGSNLSEKMNDGIAGVYESLLVYKNKKTGETIEYSSTSIEYTSSKIWEDTDWEYSSMVQKAIISTKIPSITEQFNPFISVSDISEYELAMEAVTIAVDTSKLKGLTLKDLNYKTEIQIPIVEYNVTDYDLESYSIVDTIEMTDPAFSELSIRKTIIEVDKIVLVSSKDLFEGDWRYLDRLKKIYKTCKEKKIPFAVMCNATREQIVEFREKHKFYVPIFVNDETELKAISRSNPSLIVIEKGIVKAKYPFRLTPTKKQFIKEHL